MSDPKRLTVNRTKSGALEVSYDGKEIKNVNALSVSVSPLGVAATLVFTVQEVDVATALDRIVGCQEDSSEAHGLEVN